MNLFMRKLGLVIKALLFFSISLLIVGLARADQFDTLNFVVGASSTFDDNVYRLSSNGGSSVPSKSDLITTINAGFKINKQYSLQRFRFEYTHLDTSYNKNTILNFAANNYTALWAWSLTPELTGTLSADKSESLLGFADFRSAIQNVRVTENKVFDFDWSPHANWHLIGGYSEVVNQYRQAFKEDAASTSDVIKAGFRYVFPSTSSLELMAYNRNGDLGRTTPVLSGLQDTGFLDRQEEAKFVWRLTGKTSVTSNLGYISRDYDNFSQRNYADTYGGITVNWSATDKLGLSAGLTRAVNNFQTDYSNYALLDTLFLNSTWQFSSKVSFTGSLQALNRDFKGKPTLIDFRREDTSSLVSLGVNWLPRDNISVGLSILRDKRESNLTGFDYLSNSATLNAQLTF